MINVKQSDALQISRIWGFYYKHEKHADRTKPLVVPIKDSAIQLALLTPLLFSLLSCFPFMANLFHGTAGPAAATDLCHAPAPGTVPRPVGKHLALPSHCPVSVPQLLLHLARRERWDLSPGSLRVTVRGQAEPPVLPPAESPVVSPSPLPAAAEAAGCHCRSFDKFHGKTPAYLHYLLISVSIPSIP